MADMQYNQAYLDYMRRMGLSPSPQSYGDWMLRNNLGNPMNLGSAGGGPNTATPPPPAAPPPPTTPPPGNGPTIYNPPANGGGSGGGGGGSDPGLQPFLIGGGGGSGGSGGGSSSTGGGSGMTPYIKSVTSNGGNDNSSMIQSLLQMLSRSGAAANQAGLAQYQNLLNSVKTSKQQSMGMYGQAMGQLNDFGASQKADIEQTRLNDRAGANQDLINRGLGNTTVLNTELGGADTRAQKSDIALGGTIAGMKSGLLQQKAGLNFQYGQLGADSILSKQNMQPDMGMYLQLLQSLGSSGGVRRTTPMATV